MGTIILNEKQRRRCEIITPLIATRLAAAKRASCASVETFTPAYNQRFAKAPGHPKCLAPAAPELDLDRLFSVRGRDNFRRYWLL
jgi:hypothetical protein